jgi:hypothetical protein
MKPNQTSFLQWWNSKRPVGSLVFLHKETYMNSTSDEIMGFQKKDSTYVHEY